MPCPSLISVVEDDVSVRESLSRLLKSVGYSVQGFPSAETFLEAGCHSKSHCVILDVRMPGMSGPDLQRELVNRGNPPAIIFITASENEGVRSRVLADGAVECLLKPLNEDSLLSAINAALLKRGQ